MKKYYLILFVWVLFLVSCSYNNEEETKTKDRTIITYATMHLDVSLKKWIDYYNDSQKDYLVLVKEYALEDLDSSLARMNADIVAGKNIDILDLSDINVFMYAANDVLEDLSFYIDSDAKYQRSDFAPGILNLYKSNEHIYGIAMGCGFETLIGKQKIVGENSTWTIDKMRDLVESHKKDSYIIENLSSMGLLHIIMKYGISNFINLEKNECNFSREFTNILELANNMHIYTYDEYINTENKWETALLERVYISDVNEYMDVKKGNTQEGISFVGYPSSEGGKANAFPYLPIGIISSSTNKEASWMFIRSMFEKEFQEKYIHFNFPIMKNALKEKIDNFNNYNKDYTITLHDEVQIENLINSAGNIFFNDSAIWQIIEEEASYYFEKKKTAEEVTNIIQNRVLLYLKANTK